MIERVVTRRPLCEYVSYLIFGVDMNKSEELSLNKFTNKMPINIYMFESLMIRGIWSKVHGKFVIIEEYNYVNWNFKMFE